MVASSFANAVERLRLFFVRTSKSRPAFREEPEDLVPVFRTRRTGGVWSYRLGIFAALFAALTLGRFVERTNWPLLLHAIGYTPTVVAPGALAHNLAPVPIPSQPTAPNAAAATPATLPASSTLVPGIELPMPLGRFDAPRVPALLQREARPAVSAAAVSESGVEVELEEAPQTQDSDSPVNVSLEDAPST